MGTILFGYILSVIYTHASVLSIEVIVEDPLDSELSDVEALQGKKTMDCG